MPAEPVAVVVCVAEVHGHGDVGGEEGLYGGDRADFAVVIAGGAEGVAHGGGGFAVIDEGADGGLDFGAVEVVDVVGLWEGVGVQITDIVFVPFGVDVEDVLNLLYEFIS